MSTQRLKYNFGALWGPGTMEKMAPAFFTVGPPNGLSRNHNRPFL